MREKYVYIGLTCAIVGIILFIFGIYLIQSVEAYDTINLPLSNFPMTISDNPIASYQLGQISEIVGGLFFIVGICSLVVEGFILDKRTHSKSSPVSLSLNDTKGDVARVYYTADKKSSKQKKKKNSTKNNSPQKYKEVGESTGRGV